MAVVRYRNPLDRSERFVRVEGDVPDRMTFTDDPRLFELVRAQASGDAEYETVPLTGEASLTDEALVELGWRLGLEDLSLVSSVVALLRERERDAGGVLAIAIESAA